MKKAFALALLSLATIGSMTAHSLAQTPTAAKKAALPEGLDKLGWLAGTRYIDRPDGTRSYETWTGLSGGYISGAVATASNGGMAEFFVIGPNEQGVYGMRVTNTVKGLTNWSFRPITVLEPKKIKFSDGANSFSIEETANGGIRTAAAKIENGKETQTGEWFWKAMK